MEKKLKSQECDGATDGITRRDILKGALVLGTSAAVGGVALNLAQPKTAIAATRIPNIKACVFDSYGTLFDFNSAVAKNRERVGEIADKVSALWRTKQIDYTWLRSLMGKYKDFWTCTSDALDYVFEVYGVTDMKLREDLLKAYLELSTFPEIPDTLKELKKRGFSVNILSNGTPHMLRSAVKSSGLEPIMDKIMSVDQIKIFKPDPRVYKIAVDTLKLEKHQIAFMSTNPWDAIGAAYFGFKVVWVNRSGAKRERLGIQPAAEIKTMAELPDLLA